VSQARKCFGASESSVLTSQLGGGHLKMLVPFLLGRHLNKRIRMKNKVKDEKQHICWEFWGCPDEVRKQCSAYTTHSEEECWRVLEDIPPDKYPETLMRFKHCCVCPVHKNLMENSKRNTICSN